jgi:hypothetical protein
MEHSLPNPKSGSSPAPSLARAHRLWVGIVVAAALTGCGGGDGGGVTQPPPQPPPLPANTVAMQDNSFSPATRTVAAGTTVRWVNNGSVVHNTTSDTGLWASPNVNPAGEFTRAFNTTGTFPYTCTLHPGMAGTIVVQ